LFTSRIKFSEDISDFLPVDEHYKQSMAIYQEVASANKVVLLFHSDQGPDSIIEAVKLYEEWLPKYDKVGWIENFAPQVDYNQVMEVAEFVYSHLPYLLDEQDYARLDTLLNDDAYLTQRLEWIQGQVASMSSSFVLPMLQYDPLGIGNRVSQHLRDFQPEMKFVQKDGYLFTADSTCCIVTIESPFGGSETDMNGRLVSMLEAVTEHLPEGVEVRMTGAPVIAVGNAQQIRHDTILAVSISIVLILALLFWSFRGLRSLWYILLSTGFGFLVALAGVSLFEQQFSFIVIGIASVIIGIAVNYPLHYVCHMQEEQSNRNALRDLVQPLFVGNITTVAAFLTLLPLEAVAIRQLGLFSAMMLIGTILFVLLVLPHLYKKKHTQWSVAEEKVEVMKGESLIKSPICLLSLLALTVVFGYYSWQTQFDSDVTHLNYMTPEQRADMQQIQELQGQTSGLVVYLPATQLQMEACRPVLDSLWQEGLLIDEKNPSYLFPSFDLQKHRLQLWTTFWKKHNYFSFFSKSREMGFSEEAFEPFLLSIEQEHPLMSYSDFEVLTTSVLTGYVSPSALVTKLTVKDVDVAKRVEAALPGSFDLTSLNALVTRSLTDNFNYIGFACALIVFLFLWLSFGRVELALLAFAPMAVGWLWILGLMQLLDIQFNIVNVILATFIFGQGDDYTIFITEGLIRDYKSGSGRRTLIGYQRSILLSAAIMLIGIGSLIVAKHPAMHTLAEVTIIGMSVVLLMSWLLPPMLFHWLIKYDKPLREYLNNKNIL
jgi:predicted exporter